MFEDSKLVNWGIFEDVLMINLIKTSSKCMPYILISEIGALRIIWRYFWIVFLLQWCECREQGKRNLGAGSTKIWKGEQGCGLWEVHFAACGTSQGPNLPGIISISQVTQILHVLEISSSAVKVICSDTNVPRKHEDGLQDCFFCM